MPALVLPSGRALAPWFADVVWRPPVVRREQELSERALLLLERTHHVSELLATLHAVYLFQAPLALDRFFREAWDQWSLPERRHTVTGSMLTSSLRDHLATSPGTPAGVKPDLVRVVFADAVKLPAKAAPALWSRVRLAVQVGPRPPHPPCTTPASETPASETRASETRASKTWVRGWWRTSGCSWSRHCR